MSLLVIRAYILKELKELLRSKMIIMVYFMPSMIILLFGYGIRMEVTQARTVIIDNDKSTLSHRLIDKFTHSKYFNAEVKNITYSKALKGIKRAQTDVIIIIPPDFEKKIFHSQKTQIACFIDSAFPLRASTIQGYVEGVILDGIKEFSKKFNLKASMIEINQRALFNQAMRDENAIVPGLIGLVLLIAPAILSALLIVREKERGTIFNFYSSSIRKIEFLIAKLTPVFFLHSLNIFILFLWATLFFKVPFRGSFFIYWLSSEIYILISLSIGLLVSIVTNRQIVAVVLTLIITIIPGFLYSGILMPISSMAKESFIEAHIFPVMYYNHIVYDSFLIGEGFVSNKNILYFSILSFYALFLLLLGSKLLKKELR